MSAHELDTKINEMRELQAIIAELTAEVESIKDEIKQTMIDRETETLTGNNWKASWKNVTSSRLDSKQTTTCRFVLA